MRFNIYHSENRGQRRDSCRLVFEQLILVRDQVFSFCFVTALEPQQNHFSSIDNEDLK
jgi:hypothetical protein